MHNKLDDHSVDEGNEEYVRPTIFWNDQLSFQMDLDVSVLREDKMNEILDAIENENEQDTQLMFRRFVRELLAKLRLKLLVAVLSMMTTSFSKTYPFLFLGWIDTCLTMCFSWLRSRGTQARCHPIQWSSDQ